MTMTIQYVFFFGEAGAGRVCAGNECGQAAGQMNETATESLAVFDSPSLIERDHLIN